jgi:hypothetical protein
MNVHACAELRGRYMREPRTGAYRRTRVLVHELCDSENDRRAYVVREMIGTSTVRVERFDCAGYYDLRGGHYERAMELARTWEREANEDTARRRAAGESLFSID